MLTTEDFVKISEASIKCASNRELCAKVIKYWWNAPQKRKFLKCAYNRELCAKVTKYWWNAPIIENSVLRGLQYEVVLTVRVEQDCIRHLITMAQRSPDRIISRIKT